jgi:ligand-binding sensor domain-containing protein
MSISLRTLFLLPLLWACAEEPENLKPPNLQNEFTYFSPSDGLLSNQVTALFEDSSGKIWIGTDEGISVYDGNSFQNYTAADGLVDGTIISIGEDQYGVIWAGGFDGYSTFDGQSWLSEFGIGVSALYLDKNNSFWIGTYGFGLVQLMENGQVDTYSSDECDLCNYYTKIFEDHEGELWSSTFGGAARFDNGSFTSFGTAQGVTEFLSAGTYDEWGNTFFASLEGVEFHKINKNKVSDIELPTGLTSVSGMITKNNVVYLATGGGGLLYYDGVVVRRLATPEDDNILLSILADSRGAIWIGTNDNGLIHFKPKDNI